MLRNLVNFFFANPAFSMFQVHGSKTNRKEAILKAIKTINRKFAKDSPEEQNELTAIYVFVT
uniref:Uncharacterized protein n=1 Tax=Arundo donax TaxID=35708 RepID=A0A0A9HK82_ARUDO